MGLLCCAHTGYFTVSPELWPVDHQCQSSRVWVYLHCAVEKDTRRAAGQDPCTRLQQWDPWPSCWCLPSCTQVQADHQLWNRACSGLRGRTQIPKWSQVLRELLPWESLYPTSLLETFYPALRTESADRGLVQQHCHNKDQGHSPKAKGL